MSKSTRRRPPAGPAAAAPSAASAAHPQREQRERLDLRGLEEIASMDPNELARLLDAQPAQVEVGDSVEGRITRIGKDAVFVGIGDARAFCPISHVDRARIDDPQAWVGRTLTFQVIEIGDKVVVSRRGLLQKEAESAQEAFWATAKEGDEHRGTVSSIQKFGVFVDIGGVDGLVPVRELGWGDVDPTTLARGQALDVRVIGLDRDKRKLTLSARDPKDSPWARI